MPIPALQRFFYSHYFIGGLRQALGVLLPALLAGLLLQAYSAGMVAAIGASCVAVLDQPGGPRRYRTNAMLGAVLLGTLTVLITGLASSHPPLIWLVVPGLSFLFSMLTVYGRQGGLMGFACLLIMTLTMRAPLPLHELLYHTLYSLLGGIFYFCYSYLAQQWLRQRETQQVLSVALFSTAEYVDARARFYDIHSDLDDAYRHLIRTQSTMIEAHQAARDVVLRELPAGRSRAHRRRLATLNIFIDMVALLDSLVATHTDYATLRRTLPDGDALVFARDTLGKLANNLRHIALCTARNQPALERHSAKAELRAIEYELQQYRENGLARDNPEVYALLVQVLRRLRNGTRIIERMAAHTRGGDTSNAMELPQAQALGKFVSRSELRLGMITTNLRLDAPPMRYALRVSIATLLALATADLAAWALRSQHLDGALQFHSYWIVLTIIVIMKPGFALTRQRNVLRLFGTFIGCLLALGLFQITANADVYFAVLVAACVMGYSLIQINFLGAAIFNTLTVLLVFHFLAPTTSFLVGERLVDTVIGCAIAWLCSHILPWWESDFMASLARALRTANLRYFSSGMRYAQLTRDERSSKLDAAGRSALQAELRDADMAWRLTRKNVHIAFSNYAAAFYRMAEEPARRRKHMPELNHLLIQNHVLASQISAAVPLLAALDTLPPGVQQALDALDLLLRDQDAEAPSSIETEGELATLAYPLKQMLKAAQLIRQEMRGLDGTSIPDAMPANAPPRSA